MKAWEICNFENQWKIYECNRGVKWKVKGIDVDGKHYDLEMVETGEILTDNHFLSDIAEMNFKEVIE